MTPIDDLLPLVRPFAPRCPERMMKHGIVTAAREFCRWTRWVRETIVLDAVAGQAHYTLTPQTPEHEVIVVRAAMHDDEPMKPTSPERAPIDAENSDVGRWWYFVPPALFCPVAAPESDQAGVFDINVVLQPQAGATQLTDSLVRANDQVIADGALAFLLHQPGTNWHNPQLAQAHRRQFVSMLGDRQYEADSQHQPYNFRVRSQP